MVKEVKNMSELKELIKNAGENLVILDFYAVWCGPCKDIAPTFGKFSEKYTKAVFAKIDVDNEDLADAMKEYEVNCMPTFKLIKNGKVVDTLEGSDEKELEDLIKKHL